MLHRIEAFAMISIALLAGCERGASPTAPVAGGSGGGGSAGGGAVATGTSCAAGGSVCYYVDANTGNDTNPGTFNRPFRSPQRAVTVVNPGDTVIVRDGIYTGGTGPILYIYRGGAADHPVVFKAEHQWKAVFDGQANTSATGIKLAASYLRVQGFEVRNTSHYGIDLEAGHSGLEAAGNNVHDVGRYCTNTSSGLSGFTVDDQDVVIEQNVVHDIGRYAAGENQCALSSSRANDHGVYLSSGANIIIRNNIFYNLTEGWAVHRYNSAGAPADQVYIVNNTFAYANPAHDGYIVVGSPLTNSVIANNVFYSPKTAGIKLDPGGPMSNVQIANNLTFGGPVTTGPTAGATLANNLDQTDPRFVDLAGLDFHLQAGSPAIGAGLVLPYVSNDFSGTIRAAGAPTIGAYASGTPPD